MLDGLNRINQSIADSQKRMKMAQQEIADSKNAEIERQIKNNELLEVNAQQNNKLILLKEKEIEFLSNINKDTGALIRLLTNLESINKANSEISAENMLVIQSKLDEIISISENTDIYKLFLDEFKKQIAEKGVGFGIQFFITGLKYIFTPDSVE